MALLLRLVINAVAIWLAATWVDKIELIGPEDSGTGGKIVVVLVVALIFGLVHALVRPIVKLLSLPLVIVTLGLFLLVINALMLMLTAKITETTEYGLRVHGFWAAVLGAIIITLVNWVLGVLVPEGGRD
ncbi:phage holin family protein [Nocardia transvalensis]|uniref:phage holin family protein n=1 Tax=Nocardia transvalensis TaxID=37333 RepID=UPI00189393FC|nr:phage holin family protein [Nocardia transvalensis]MBF6333732.1 phage holin family protein [Nocardia transvalensis]